MKKNKKVEETIDNSELNKLEEEFRKTYKEVAPIIESELKTAEEAVKRAVELAEKHGVPFVSPVSLWVNDNYIPHSFEDLRQKMEEVNKDEDNEVYSRLESILGFSPNNYPSNEPGWESDGWSSSSLTC